MSDVSAILPRSIGIMKFSFSDTIGDIHHLPISLSSRREVTAECDR